MRNSLESEDLAPEEVPGGVGEKMGIIRECPFFQKTVSWVIWLWFLVKDQGVTQSYRKFRPSVLPQVQVYKRLLKTFSWDPRIRMRNSKIWITGKYIHYGSFFFFGSKENLFHAKNILFD